MKAVLTLLRDCFARPSLLRAALPQHRPARPRFRPSFDDLEDRCLRAVATVSLLTDTSAASSPGEFRTVLATAAPGDTIVFEAGLTGTIDLTAALGSLTFTKDLTVTGPGASEIAVSGQNAIRVFSIDAGITVSLSGLTISGGNASSPPSGSPSGGGIGNQGTLTLQSSILSGNTAAFGGAISNQGTLTLQDSTVSGNSAIVGGGITNQGTLTLQASTLSGNSASAAGGIDNQAVLTVSNSILTENRATGQGGAIVNQGTLTVQNSTLSANTANNNGGGISNVYAGTLLVLESTLSGNSAPTGGGISNFVNASLTIQNSTLSGNSATAGGGINNVGTLTVQNSTLSGNTAQTGGGLENFGTATLQNSLLSGNSADAGSEIFNGDTGTLQADAHNLFGHDGLTTAEALSGFTSNRTDLTATSDGTRPTPLNAILGPLLDNGGATFTHALAAGSPAIDAGNDALVAADVDFDQRGDSFGRFVGTVDIGAFEVQPPSFDVSGNVAARVSSRGDLTLTGDTRGNGVSVTAGLTPDTIIVTGLGNTTIDGQVSVTLGGVTGNVTINLGQGDDVLLLGGAVQLDVARNLTINLGRDDDVLDLKNVTAAGTATISGAGGADAVTLADAAFSRDLKVNLGKGANSLTLDRVAVNGKAKLEGGSAADVFQLMDSAFAGSLVLDLGNGDNTLQLDTVNVTGKTTVTAGKGADVIAVLDSVFGDRFKLSTGNGNDQVTLTGSTFDALALLDGGCGVDTLDAGLPNGTGNGNVFLSGLSIENF
jgi:hypothetical protein